MDTTTHDPSEYIRGIQQLLVSDKKRIGFLFGAIAKEGRKYGVGLLVTQRPSELDETVLSQCGTMIALRMNDRSHIKAAVQDELQTMVDLLPSLRTGEELISGEAVKIPSREKFYKMANAPKGADPKVCIQWRIEIEQIEEEYKKLLQSWKNQNFNN